MFETWDYREVGPNPASVQLTGGITKQIQPYEFIRCDVCIKIPCYPTKVDCDKAVDEAQVFISEHMNRLVSTAVAVIK